MKENADKIGFVVTLAGIVTTTLGHYLEAWPMSYGLSVMIGLVASIVFS